LNEEATGCVGAAEFQCNCTAHLCWRPTLSSLRVEGDSVKQLQSTIPAWTTRSGIYFFASRARSSSR